MEKKPNPFQLPSVSATAAVPVVAQEGCVVCRVTAFSFTAITRFMAVDRSWVEGNRGGEG